MKKCVRGSAIAMLVLLFLGGASMLVVPVRQRSEEENRPLAIWPRLTWETFLDGTFEEDFESAVSDQFVLRNVSIQLNTMWNRLLGKRLVGGVVYAGENYLIEHTASDAIDLERLLANERQLTDSAEHFAQLLGEDAVHIYFVPSKENALSRLLPAHLTAFDGGVVPRRVSESLWEGAVTELSDTLDATDGQVFYYTDHHWTTGAAYLAYGQWCRDFNEEQMDLDHFQVQTVTEDFLGTTQAKTLVSRVKDSVQCYRTDSPITVSYPKGYEADDTAGIYQSAKLDTRDKYGVFFGGNTSYIYLHNEAGNGARMLLFKDSFANCFVPFLTEHVSDILMVDLRYVGDELSDTVAEFGVPDQVLYMYNTVKFAEDTNLYKLSTIQSGGESDEELGEDDDIFL